MFVYIDIYTLYALYYCPNTTGMTHLKTACKEKLFIGDRVQVKLYFTEYQLMEFISAYNSVMVQ
jgi:hypothetical protein